MRQRISPVQTPDRGPAGFTLVEVLVALLVAMLLVGAAASALIGILRAEETSLRMQKAALQVQSVTCESLLGMGITGAAHVVGEEWSVSYNVIEPTLKQTNTWNVWTILPTSGSGPMVMLYFQ